MAELLNHHFLFASPLGTNHDLLCFVHGQGQKSEQKHRTKSFAKLHNHLPLLTILPPMESLEQATNNRETEERLLYLHASRVFIMHQRS